jgi:hypothetical protein
MEGISEWEMRVGEGNLGDFYRPSSLQTAEESELIFQLMNFKHEKEGNLYLRNIRILCLMEVNF